MISKMTEHILRKGEKPINIEPRKISDYTYVIEKQDGMKVPVKIFADESLLRKMMDDKCIGQGVNMTILPGIKGDSIMLPDAHQGYGFCIGGVAAIDAENGCISPSSIGFDINCGVRLLRTNLKKEEVQKNIKPLLDSIFMHVPPGVGRQSNLRLSWQELDTVLDNGAQWAVEKGYGVKEDMEYCEENSCMTDADHKKVSKKAKERGIGQLGTLGAGNHFIEIQYVAKIFNKDVAKVFGVEEGQVMIMIHCGSRGLGHQVCSDYLRKIEETYPDIVASLPDKDLAYAPAKSDLAQDYYKAMCAAANFAWTNRHIIAHEIRKSFTDVFGETHISTLYDVAHNIAKREEHVIDGEKITVWVHRKGATRAFGPGRKEIPELYRRVGQPIILPGSMGTSSYVLVGTADAMKESFGSTAHGAGRLMSRHSAIQKWSGEAIKNELEKEHIFIKAASWKGISEEAPGAYKNVDEVVKISDEAGIGKIVAQLRPIGVVKG